MSLSYLLEISFGSIDQMQWLFIFHTTGCQSENDFLIAQLQFLHTLRKYVGDTIIMTILTYIVVQENNVTIKIRMS